MSIFENTVLVNKKTSIGTKIGGWVCIALIAFCGITSILFVSFILLLLAVLFGAIWYMLYLNSKIEYEYTYIEGRMSIARIKAKRKRKELARIEMEEVILIAPTNSHELDSYFNNNQIKRKVCTSGLQDIHSYQVVYKTSNDINMIEFEPDQNMLEMIQARNPRKVLI
jgi:hypothetical protein